MPSRVPKSWFSPPGGRSKYRSDPCTVDGIRFASKKEARRYGELLILRKAGEIRHLQLQVPFGLMGLNGPIVSDGGKPLTYIADFTYTDLRTGEHVVEDAKGFETREYKLKKAILRAQGVTIREV